MTRVRQETIDKISKMGMALSLKYARDNNDPEFREAIKRYYPHAKYGPKTEAAANAIIASQAKTATSSPTTSPSIAAAVDRQVSAPGVAKKDRSVGGITSIAGIKDPLGYKHQGPRQNFVSGLKIIGRALKPPGAKMWPSVSTSKAKQVTGNASREARLRANESKNSAVIGALKVADAEKRRRNTPKTPKSQGSW